MVGQSNEPVNFERNSLRKLDRGSENRTWSPSSVASCYQKKNSGVPTKCGGWSRYFQLLLYYYINNNKLLLMFNSNRKLSTDNRTWILRETEIDKYWKITLATIFVAVPNRWIDVLQIQNTTLLITLVKNVNKEIHLIFWEKRLHHSRYPSVI